MLPFYMGQALCLNNPYIPNQVKLSPEHFNSFCPSTSRHCFLGSCLNGWWQSSTVANNNYQILESFPRKVNFNSVHWSWREAESVSQAIPPPSASLTGLCAHWEKQVSPFHIPIQTKVPGAEGYLAGCPVALYFPLWPWRQRGFLVGDSCHLDLKSFFSKKKKNSTSTF